MLVDAVRSTERMIDMVLRDMSLGNIALLLRLGYDPGARDNGDRMSGLPSALLDGGPWYGLPSARGRRISDLILRPLRGRNSLHALHFRRALPRRSGIRPQFAFWMPGRMVSPPTRTIHRVLYDRRRDPHLLWGRPGSVTGALRYVEHAPTINPASKGRNIYCPDVKLRPNGDWTLTGRSEQRIPLSRQYHGSPRTAPPR